MNNLKYEGQFFMKLILFFLIIFCKPTESKDLIPVEITEGNNVYVIFIDGKKKKVASKVKYLNAGVFSEGFAPVLEIGTDRFRYIDTNFNFVFDKKFESASPFINGKAEVRIGKKRKYIDTKGNIIEGIKENYDEVCQSDDYPLDTTLPYKNIELKNLRFTYAKISWQEDSHDEPLFHLIECDSNQKSKVLTKNPFRFLGERSFRDSYVVIDDQKRNEDSYSHLMDKNGKILSETKTPERFKFNSNQFAFNDGKALIFDASDQDYKTKYIINKEGKILGQYESNTYEYKDYKLDDFYENAFGTAFNEGLMRVYKYGKFGYINEKAELVIPTIYENAGRFQEGLAPVYLKEENNPENESLQVGFIDKKGNFKIGPFSNKDYSIESSFSFEIKGYAKVRENGLGYYIDRNGSRLMFENKLLSLVGKSMGFKIIEQHSHVKSSIDDKKLNSNLVVKVDKSCGIMTYDAQIIVKPEFDSCFSFYELNYAIHKNKNEFQVFDKTGKEIYKMKFDFIKNISSPINVYNFGNRDSFLIQFGDENWIWTKSGNVLFKPIQKIRSYGDRLKTEYSISRKGDYIEVFSENRKTYLYNHKGELVWSNE